MRDTVFNFFSSYRKTSLSRNALLIILAACLAGVGAKIALAHEKIRTFTEAEALYNAGRMRAAEAKYRAAKLNVSVADHNAIITARLAELSPIRETISDLDGEAADYFEEGDLEGLVETDDAFAASRKDWETGTPAEADMLGEMIAHTGIDKDLKNYFAKATKSLFAELDGGGLDGDAEKRIFESLDLIPSRYYGGDAEKVSTIRKNFTDYYSGRIEAEIRSDSFVSLVREGERQFSMMRELELDSGWLKERLNAVLLEKLRAPYNARDYETFAELAKNAGGLEFDLKEGPAFNFIASSLAALENRADALARSTKFEEAITILRAIAELKDTKEQIAALEYEWDKHEPIRVLKRKHPGQEFTAFIDGRNAYGAESYVAAISAEGVLYFGKINGREAVEADEAEVDPETGELVSDEESGAEETSSAIGGAHMEVVTSTDSVPASVKNLGFSKKLGSGANPVIYFEADSAERNKRYMAYEVQETGIFNLLDLEADGFTYDGDQLLLVDNPTGDAAGELAYYRPGYNGYYELFEIKLDYTEISLDEILDYKGEKVRFGATVQMEQDGYYWILVSNDWNEENAAWEESYVLVEWDDFLNFSWSYTFTGTYTRNATVTDANNETRSFPVVTVSEVE